MRTKTFSMTAALMAATMLPIVGAVSCSGRGKAPPAPQEVGSSDITRGTIERTVLFTGNIVAQDAVNVYARGSGKVTKKLLKEGDRVKRGQGILIVDRDEVGYTFRPLEVDSPIDGFVGTINVDVGAYVYDRSIAGQQLPVAVVVRPGAMRVKLDIPERYLEAIRPGAPVTMIVDTLGGAEYRGTIVTESPVVNEKTRTANVEVEIPNTDGRLRHGMFGRMKLAVEHRDGVLIAPIAAVSWEGEKTIVYRIADGKVHRIEVKPGLRNTVNVEILEGLAEGDRVATGRLIDLEEGEVVNVRAENKTGASAQ
ncbi:MAG: efflux RND transporter periplasmic adaptor subunit [Pseudomonadota bacterium]